MDSAFIHQAANELVQNAGTRNIKQIARSCSLDISETSRIKDMLVHIAELIGRVCEAKRPHSVSERSARALS